MDPRRQYYDDQAPPEGWDGAPQYEQYDQYGQYAQAEAEPPPPPSPELHCDRRLLDLAVGFLVEAPPGEFDDCLAALTKFVSDRNIPTAARRIALPVWMKEHCLPVDVEGARAIICEEAMLEQDLFLDPTSMRPFRYDFETRSVAQILSQTRQSSSLRDTMQGIVQKFASSSMRNGTCAVYDTSDGGVTIVISGSSISKENFRTGTVIMRFRYARGGRVTGTIRWLGHYYEQGNAMSDQKATFNEQIGGGSESDIAANFVKKVGSFYTQWTQALQNAFELLTNEGLDRLRRRLPIMKTHVNWRGEIVGSASMPVGGGRKK
jgi:hypothetical protein